MINFNPRQKEALRLSDSRINLFDGSVRSGKTVVCNYRWAEFVGSAPPGLLLMTGKTLKTLERNVLLPMKEDGFLITWNLTNKRCKLFHRTIELEGANDNKAMDKIVGSTLSGHYGDEASKMPENFFTMALSRMSVKGAKGFYTTNPDSPYLWLKKNYIDRRSELDMCYMKFVIDDNPKLDPEYVKQIKLEYTGLWHKRYIQGLWVVAEGAVYDMFDDKLHVVNELPEKMINYWVGVDYGTSNQTVFLLVGQSRDGTLYVCREYVWDSRETGRQKTDAQYVQDYKDFIGGINPVGVYVDPSAASFAVAMRQAGIRTSPANNDVLHGIREVSTLLSAGFLKFHKSCKHTIEQMSAYVWDSKAQILGEDKPMKQADHACFPAGTMVTTDSGDKCISKIKPGDMVLTRGGYRPVLESMATGIHETVKMSFSGYKIECTADHPIYTKNRGFIKSSGLMNSDIVCILQSKTPWKNEPTKASTLEDTPNQKTYPTGDILNPHTHRGSTERTIFTESFGQSNTEQYPKGITSITKMMIRVITIFQILNACLQRIIPLSMRAKEIPNTSRNERNDLIESDHLQRNGIGLKRVANGILNTAKRYLKIWNPEHVIAISAAPSTAINLTAFQGSAPITASQNTGERRGLTSLPESVIIAASRSGQTNILKQVTVRNLVRVTQERKKVYNICVDEYHEYFADGILVKNCDALRYTIRSTQRYWKPLLQKLAA